MATFDPRLGSQDTAETILRAWFEGKSDHTIRSYEHDLEDFALFLSGALGISPMLKRNQALSTLSQAEDEIIFIPYARPGSLRESTVEYSQALFIATEPPHRDLWRYHQSLPSGQA